jgi:hypothetical protein
LSPSAEQIEAEASVDNPFQVRATARDADPARVMEQALRDAGVDVEALKTTQYGQRRLDPKRVTAELQRRGFDGVEVHQDGYNDEIAGSQLVVFDPAKVSIPAGTEPVPSDEEAVHQLDPDDAAEMADLVVGTDDRATYLRTALQSGRDIGATVLATAGDDGVPNAALGLVDRTEEGEGMFIDYLGSTRPGGGRELVLEAARRALDEGSPLYAEPTAGSRGFWERMGFVEDPEGIGAPFSGVALEDLPDWIARTEAGSTRPAPEPAPAPSVSDVVNAYAWGGLGIQNGLEVNGRLRKGDDQTDRQFIEALDGAIAGQKTRPKKTVHRILSDPDVADAVRRLEKGDSYSDPGFMSTTADRAILGDFQSGDDADRVDLQINLPPGFPRLDVDKYTGEKDYKQSEVLLPRGVRWKVVRKIRRGDGSVVVTLQPDPAGWRPSEFGSAPETSEATA